MSLRSVAGNVALLIGSLFLAIIIWVAATQETDPVTAINGLQIPIEVIGQRPDVDVGNVPDTAQVTLEGPERELADLPLDEIRADEIAVIVDLSEVPIGQSVVPVQVPFQFENVRISDPFPSQVSVVLEEIVRVELPVNVDIRGTIARGHTKEDPLVEPETIAVRGPSSRVEQLAEAEATIFLDNARETIIASPPLIFRDESGSVVSTSGLGLSADSVQVTVPINELAGYSEKPITAVWSGDPAPGYRVTDVTLEPSSVLVTGRSVQLDLLNRLRTEEVSLAGLTQSLTQQVSLDLPAGIELEEFQPIIMSVEIEPILSTSVFDLTVDVLGEVEELEVTLEADQVRVFIFGPLPAIDNLTSTDVRASIDIFGLQPGAYTLEPQIDLNDELLEIRSWQPGVINLFITRTITTSEEITPVDLITDTTLMPLVPEPIASDGISTGSPAVHDWLPGYNEFHSPRTHARERLV